MSGLLRLGPAGALILALAGCGGGSSADLSGGGVAPGTPACNGSCATASTLLTQADVEQVLSRGIAEAQARGAAGTLAVVDRVGNVLAVYRMAGATVTVTVRSTAAGAAAIDGGLEQVTIIPDTMAAITKAVTGAYLSSEGNAFGTRTASQIVQSHFNPGELLTPAGPLFGVQFSQLPCSDLNSRAAGAAATAGPKRSPLGLSADPGGLPLYKGGTPVGAVGVIADGIYGLDSDVTDRDLDLDELIATAAAYGLAAPDDRRAERITADGRTLRLADATVADLASVPANAAAFGTLGPGTGALVAVPGYADGSAHAGVAFGQPASGVRPDHLDFAGLDAFVLVDDTDTERYRPRDGTETPVALSAAEVREMLVQALTVASRSRAQIRRPVGSSARVTISVVDTQGTILGIVASRDAPLFGVDVSLQKARSAAWLSGSTAAADLAAVPAAEYLAGGLTLLRAEPLDQYTTNIRAFLGRPTALADGAIAFSARATGNLSRPFYPDGVDGATTGPWSKPAGQWSPFSTGLQLDLVYNAIIQHVAFVSGLAADVGANCTGVGGFTGGFAAGAPIAALANGLQVFPGGVPVYRAGVLLGGIGVSGDGVDQDDMVAFLGVAQASAAFPALGNAPAALRSDTLTPGGARLRYVNCPQSPFLDSSTQDACSGH